MQVPRCPTPRCAGQRGELWCIFTKITPCAPPQTLFGHRQLPDSHGSPWRAAPHRTPADGWTFWGSTYVFVFVYFFLVVVVCALPRVKTCQVQKKYCRHHQELCPQNFAASTRSSQCDDDVDDDDEAGKDFETSHANQNSCQIGESARFYTWAHDKRAKRAKVTLQTRIRSQMVHSNLGQRKLSKRQHRVGKQVESSLINNVNN